MVRSQSETSLQLFWTILLVYAVKNASSIEEQEVMKGENVTLLCKGKKPLNWLNEKNEIIGRQIGRIQQNVLGHLTIKSVRLSDSGVYTCAKIDGIVMQRINLHILAAPILVNVTRIVEVEKDNPAIMHCGSVGYPKPVISWFMYKGGQKEKFGEGTTFNARMPCEYCQVYFMCTAENRFGVDNENITVNVVGKPEVRILEDSITGVLGKNVTMHCSIRSFPPVKYMKWLKNGKLVTDKNRRKFGFKFLDKAILFTLSIENLKEKDFSEYECLAVNKFGKEVQKVQITSTTELVISTGEIQRQEPKSKNQDLKDNKEEAETQSTESVNSNMGSVCKNSWQQFTAMILISFLCTPLLLS